MKKGPSLCAELASKIIHHAGALAEGHVSQTKNKVMALCNFTTTTIINVGSQ